LPASGRPGGSWTKGMPCGGVSCDSSQRPL
jgi:hypothetical protein